MRGHTPGDGGDYYLKRRKKIVRRFRSMLKKMRPYIASQFGEDFAEGLIPKLLSELEDIIPMLPDIGGKKSPFIEEMVLAAYALSFYRAMTRREIPVREIGMTLYKSFEYYLTTLPGLLRWLMGMWSLSYFMKRKYERGVTACDVGTYPAGFVYGYVRGDGKAFDYGLDITECALLKFFTAQGVGEFTPYLCITDYCVCRSLGVGFSRTSTLASGGTTCDFRFTRGGDTAQGWPPETLPEWKA